MARIVVVDDDAGVREMLADLLHAQGHAATAFDSGAALREASPSADLYLLDLRLPGEDGFGLARWLREAFDPGIIMLTGSGDDMDRIIGLEIGADDYLSKPFAPAELTARIDAVLRRRTRPTLPEGTVAFGTWRFDLAAFVLRDADGVPLALNPMETDLVAAFATNPGRILSRDDLLRLAPPRDDESLDRSIDHRVTRLRRKIEADPAHPQIIKTVRGGGYLFPG